jgi:acyl-CoA thioesterase FadM
MSAVAQARLEPAPLASLPDKAWRTEVFIRFSHCDPAGIVYFARYFDIANGVIEDWFSQSLGLAYADFLLRRRIGLGYASCHVDFAAPGFMGDRMTFAVLIEQIGRSSLALRVEAYRGEQPILSARLTIVATSLAEHRAIPLPDDLRAALEQYQRETQ